MCKTARILFTVAFAVLLVAGVGCGRNRLGKNRSRVSGTVTVGGQPVKAGHITFRAAEGRELSAPVLNGRYSLYSRYPMSPGKYHVTVQYSSTGSSRGGYDRQHTETVSVGGFGRDYIDFRVK